MGESRWYESLPHWARQVVDQALHALAGASIAGLVGGVASIWLDGWGAGLIGATISTVAAAVRELVQNVGDKANDAADAVLDWAVWTAAGVLVGAIIWGTA